MKKSARTLLILGVAVFHLALGQIVRGQVVYPLDRTVAKAKADHVTAITISAGHISYYGESSDLDETLTYYSAVVVRPVASTTIVIDGSIETWFKFNVVSVLHKSTKCSPCDEPINAPKTLGKLEANQIAVPYVGGITTIDGIRVTVTGVSSATFSSQSEYVLFVSIQPDGAAAPVGGAGAFVVGPDGSLRPALPRDRLLTDEILKLGNLHNLQNKIHAKFSQP